MLEMDLIPEELKHIYWRSRRGLTELEMKLVPFARDCYLGLEHGEQVLYEALLSREDVEINDLLLRRVVPSDPALMALIEKIIGHRSVL